MKRVQRGGTLRTEPQKTYSIYLCWCKKIKKYNFNLLPCISEGVSLSSVSLAIQWKVPALRNNFAVTAKLNHLNLRGKDKPCNTLILEDKKKIKFLLMVLFLKAMILLEPSVGYHKYLSTLATCKGTQSRESSSFCFLGVFVYLPPAPAPDSVITMAQSEQKQMKLLLSA